MRNLEGQKVELSNLCNDCEPARKFFRDSPDKLINTVKETLMDRKDYPCNLLIKDMIDDRHTARCHRLIVRRRLRRRHKTILF